MKPAQCMLVTGILEENYLGGGGGGGRRSCTVGAREGYNYILQL